MNGSRPGEFETIARFFAPLASGFEGALGLTDDAALIAPAPGFRLAVTADALVAGVHFFPDDPPNLIARKALRVNLSDLAAMGAEALAYVLTIAVPSEVDGGWLEMFAAGLATDNAIFRVHLIGGDTVSTPGPLTLSVTAFGQIEAGRELRRSGARPGDQVYVSGSIGDAALGLKCLQGELAGLDFGLDEELIDRYRLPRPRLDLGQALVGLASAAMDVSDGLVADLGHICETSRVGAVIEAERVPRSYAAARLLEIRPDLLALMITGGDDYELLFTVPAGRSAEVEHLATILGLTLTRIGRIKAEAGLRVQDAMGRDLVLAQGGFRHF